MAVRAVCGHTHTARCAAAAHAPANASTARMHCSSRMHTHCTAQPLPAQACTGKHFPHAQVVLRSCRSTHQQTQALPARQQLAAASAIITAMLRVSGRVDQRPVSHGWPGIALSPLQRESWGTSYEWAFHRKAAGPDSHGRPGWLSQLQRDLGVRVSSMILMNGPFLNSGPLDPFFAALLTHDSYEVFHLKAALVLWLGPCQWLVSVSKKGPSFAYKQGRALPCLHQQQAIEETIPPPQSALFLRVHAHSNIQTTPHRHGQGQWIA
jgi:hypothetical protein